MTLANQFICDYDTNKSFSFKTFFKKYYGPDKTPIKDKMQFGNNTNEILILKSARNIIFKNLSLNKAFLLAEEESPRSIAQKREVYEQLNLLMINTKDEISASQKAQILFLIHLSKLSAPSETYCELFRSVNTIRIENDITGYIFSGNLATVFQKLITNAQIIQTINEVIETVTRSKSTYDISSTKLTYFETIFSHLYGFAGINEIYLNIEMLNLFYSELLNKYQHDDKITILNLIFAKIVVHEITHVALRYTFNDFNISTPTFNDQNDKETTLKLDEAGCITENILFKARIDWIESAEKGFNLDYCKSFMQRFLNNDKVDFDHLSSETTIDDSDYACVAFSMSLKKKMKKKIFFF